MSVVVDDRAWKVERGDDGQIEGRRSKIKNQRELSECARASPIREGRSVCSV
jgi:hypothetical protein